MNRKSKKSLIFEAAAILFRTKGYAASSMRDIALEVGIEPSSLYSHISSKEDILKKICFDCAAKFIDGMQLITISDKSISEKIYQIVKLHIEIAIDDPSSVTVFNDEWKHMTNPNLAEFVELRRAYEESIRSTFEFAMKNSVIKNVNLKITVNTFLSSLKWINHSRNKEGLFQSKDDIIDQIHQIFTHGLFMGNQ